jgi:hypothetical protein
VTIYGDDTSTHVAIPSKTHLFHIYMKENVISLYSHSKVLLICKRILIHCSQFIQPIILQFQLGSRLGAIGMDDEDRGIKFPVFMGVKLSTSF